MLTLLRLEVYPLFVRWLASTLLQRKVVLRCDSWPSEVITVCPILPQVSHQSYLVYTIWQLLLNNWMKRDGHRHLLMTFWCIDRKKTKNKITYSMQSELDCITSWCTVSKALVNPTRAPVIWLYLNNHIINTDVH